MGDTNITRKTLWGVPLYNYLNHNFVSGTTQHNVIFKEIPNADIIIKENNFNGEPVYNFSLMYHKLVQPKFELEKAYDYYVLEKDIKRFNKMNEIEQKDYLDNLKNGDVCFGMVDKMHAAYKLTSKIQLDTPYTVKISDSETTANYWWTIEELDLSIYADITFKKNKQLKMDIEIPIDTTAKSIENSTIKEMLYGLDLVSSIRTVVDRDPKNAGKGYHTLIKVCAFIKDEKKWKVIFQVAVRDAYPEKGKMYYFQINKNFFNSFNSSLTVPTYFVKTKENVKKILVTIAEALNDSPYYYLGEGLLEYLEK